jgi:hypothetical protein
MRAGAEDEAAAELAALAAVLAALRTGAGGEAGVAHNLELVVGGWHFSPRYCCASKHGSIDDGQ